MAIRDMVARHSHPDDNQQDFIPTPLYATRVLFEEVAPWMKTTAPQQSIWDPAAGQRHMTRVFREYGYKTVIDTEIRDENGLDFRDAKQRADVIVTNPPYGGGLIEVFVRKGLELANQHFALLTRVNVLEGQKRYREFFTKTPPTKIAFFSDRIPFRVGKLDRKASKMFFHVWLYWDMPMVRKCPDGDYITTCSWIDDRAQTKYEKEGDWL